jgi:23S rRNA-/tRNA-specific pseudouridylate synthase
MALHSASLKIFHPYTNKEMTFDTEIPGFFKTLVK